MHRMRRIVRLARWLGPWARDDARPEVEIDVFESQAGHRVRRFRPADGAKSIWIIAPGLHYEGPDDPRMERFASVLAYAGHEVWVPYLLDYLSLLIEPRAIDHYLDVVDEALRDGRNVSLFSISFGSLLALRAAASEAVRDRIERLVVFGGYAHLRQTMHFCMTGTIDGEEVAVHDPLNRPILFMHVLDHLDHGLDADAAGEVVEAWRAYMRATWGRPEMRVDDRHLEVARSFRKDLDEKQRALFDQGVGLTPGGWELIDQGLQEGDFDHLDPTPHLSEIECPVYLVHGGDDDVIPYTQALELERLLRPHTRVQVHITGLYGHTSKAVTGSSIVAELRTMLEILRILARE